MSKKAEQLSQTPILTQKQVSKANRQDSSKLDATPCSPSLITTIDIMRNSLRREYLTEAQYKTLKNLGSLCVYCRRRGREIIYYAVGTNADIKHMLSQANGKDMP